MAVVLLLVVMVASGCHGAGGRWGSRPVHMGRAWALGRGGAAGRWGVTSALQLAGEPLELVAPTATRDLGRRHQPVEAVRSAWIDVQLDGNRRLVQTLRVGDVLVTEAVEGADAHEGRREPGQVRS